MVKCSECGAENPDEAEFCKKCGAKLATLTPVSEEKSSAKSRSKKKVGAIILIGFIFGFIIIGITYTLIPSGGGGEGPSLPSGSGGESEPSGGGGGTATLKVAVYNDTSSYVTDVNLIIDDESVKQMTIYNGYWADWGTYTLEEGTHDIRLEVEYFDLNHNSYGTKVKKGTEEAKAGVVYSAGYRITTSYIFLESYPEATMEPTPVEW